MSTTSNDNVVSLKDADLRGVKWERAYLSEANLRSADLSHADLSHADLSSADLTGVTGITVEILEKQAASLKGATMPDGKEYP